LAIIDLSATGHQPMTSSDGRYRLVTNGEIYNFRDLRQDLEKQGRRFRGPSDTEVMLHAFCTWGLEGALQRFNGMFAFALWDSAERRLHLCRDRIGEKSLYYGRVGNGFAFASELKALRVLPGFSPAIDRAALTDLVGSGYIAAPRSIYRHISKLPAGCLMSITGDGNIEAPRPWWQPQQLVGYEPSETAGVSVETTLENLDSCLRRAIERRLVADVPVGAFLSGGVDSSLVVALAQRLRGTPMQTFTIGFEDPAFDESPWAHAVADHLGTDHTEIRITSEDAMGLVDEIPTIYDEPFADSSQIPMYLVSRLARQHVKVVLSGDGGDELFGGYPRFTGARQLWHRLAALPTPLRRLMQSGLSFRPPLPRSSRRLPFGSLVGKLNRFAEALSTERPEELYRLFFSQCPNPAATVINAPAVSPIWDDAQAWPAIPQIQTRLMYLDLVTYLPEGVLVKLDRASMRTGLEGRLPLLDPDVVEFAWRLPAALKIRQGEGKWILRQLLDRYVPRRLIERPKAGFEIPLGSWLRGPLRGWSEALLAPERLRDEGFFRAEIVERRWREHLSGVRDWRFFLWSVLMFQLWREKVH
jgi:asparagine synthase (glutamine-hydrolysing)